MVMKKCIICGEPFDARGRDKCCSPECTKEKKRRNAAQWREANPERQKEYYENNCDRIREQQKEYYENNRDEILERNKEYRENNPDKIRERRKKYYENNRDEINEKKSIRRKNEISELIEQYNGDLEQILENCPTGWMLREAKMQVWFGESYADGMIAKIKSTPVCEVTSEKTNDLVIHHLWSFNTHPELGNDPANMVRITKDIHNEFHKIFGYGNNTPEQWNEFVEKFNTKGGDNI